ncbi:hypothetical protein HY493_02640 [Candidatus Woesearchaeota archaeon]|nr:hypothetical protein [Candidatus Woesearchaeota archaeon]
MKKTVLRFHSFIRDLLAGWVLSILYVTGLTLLFPFLYFLALPGATSPILLVTAVVLVVLSFFGFVWNEGSINKALKTLSRITLIPGMIGVLFSVFGRDVILGYIQSKFVATPSIFTFVISNLETAVPKIRVLTVVYILLGIFLWFIGDRFEGKKGII